MYGLYSATAICVLAMLSGCAGSNTYSRMLEGGGLFRVDEPTGPDHDYRVVMKRGRDFGLDTADPRDRLQLVQSYLGERCQGIRVIRETYLPTGTTAFGIETGQWTMHIACGR